MQIASFPLVIAMHPTGRPMNLAQFIQLAKAKPGKLSYAAGSTPFQVITELFKIQAGIDIKPIPYSGSSKSIIATIAGETDLVTVDLPPALAQLRAGKLQGLAVTGLKRSAMAPDLPTVAESGLPNFEAVLWTGIFAPAGTAKDVVDKLHDAVARILLTDDFKTRLAELGYEPGNLSQAEFAALLKADIAKWTRVEREGDIHID